MAEEHLDYIHRFEPPADPDDRRVLLLLHGTGGSENDLIHLGKALDHKAAILSPRGKVLENGMPRFFRRFAEGVFDVEDIKFHANELADFVLGAADAYGFDRDRITAVGYSNGANIAAAMLLLRPEVLDSAILLRPMVPLVPEQKPDLTGVRVLISAGRFDPIARPEESERLAVLLRDAGADVTLHWQDIGHELTGGDVRTGWEWLNAGEGDSSPQRSQRTQR